MTNSIDWEKQYHILLKQMKEMMKMSLRLLNRIEEKNFIIKDIFIEKAENATYIIVVSISDSPKYKYDFIDSDGNVLFTITDTFKNCIEIPSSLKLKTEKIEVSIKNLNNAKYSEPSSVDIAKNI